MWRYILRRVLISGPVLLGISVVLFLVAHSMPGNYVASLMPPDSVPGGGMVGASLRLQEYYGLDKSLPEQYVVWLRELLKGNLGYSFATGEPVLKHLLDKLPATVELTVTAMVFSLVSGSTLGIVSAIKQYSWLDHVLTFLGFVWVSTPSFVFAMLGLYLFYLKIPLFPLGGAAPMFGKVNLVTLLRHLILPAAVLGLEGVATYMRHVRSSLLEVLQQPYVTSARAKGLVEGVVILRHALRNALLSLITLVALRLPSLIGGTFLLEVVFNWPGMGRYSLIAITRRDYPVIMGTNLLVAVFVLFSNLLADILYAVVDPRIHYQ